jgi:hypothetical protein
MTGEPIHPDSAAGDPAPAAPTDVPPPARPSSPDARAARAAEPGPPPVLNGQFLDDYQDIPDSDAAGLVRAYRRRLVGSPIGGTPILQAVTEARRLEPELILGKSDLLPFDFLRTGDRLGRAVVKIVRGDGASGTGFLVASEILLTNHHVLPTPAEAASATALANYEVNPPDDPRGRAAVVPLRPGDLFVANAELDFAFCGVRGLDHLGVIPLERNGLDLMLTEYVNVIQHPMGRPKQVALQDNRVVQLDHVVARYSCDTEPGSSGSPVFNNEWRLVALHHASVLVDRSAGGRPARGADPTLHYLNEGIRLSAIALWLDSDEAEQTPWRDQVARLRAIFRGLDPRVGLFGGLGRAGRSRGPAQMVVECYRRDDRTLDLAHWDVGGLGFPSWERLEVLGWIMSDLGMDLWCLAGLPPEAARRLCEFLATRLQLDYELVAPPADGPGLSLLRRRDCNWQTELADPDGDWPRGLILRAAARPERALRVLAEAPGPPGWREAALGAPPPRRPALAPCRVEAWLASLGAPGSWRPAVLIGPGAPATPDALAALRQGGWMARLAALGPDGACAIVGGRPGGPSRVIVGPNLVPILGASPMLVAALDREFPRAIKDLGLRDPLAVRLVFDDQPGEPAPDNGPRHPSRITCHPAGPPASRRDLERLVARLIEPVIARLVDERVRPDPPGE